MTEEYNYYHLENVNYIHFSKWLETTCNEIGLRAKSYNGLDEIWKITVGKFQEDYYGPITYKMTKLVNGYSVCDEGSVKILSNKKDLAVFWEFTGNQVEEFIQLLEKIRKDWNPKEGSYIKDENGEFRVATLDYYEKDIVFSKRGKPGPKPGISKAEKNKLWKQWQKVTEKGEMTFKEWSGELFGFHSDGSLKVPYSTFHYWKNK